MPDAFYTLGLDVSKARLEASLLPTREAFAVPNTAAGHDQLKARLRAVPAPCASSWRPPAVMNAPCMRA